METELAGNSATGVPKQVFEKFLVDLPEKGVSVDVVARLQKTLIDQGNITEFAIKKALFGDNGIDI